MAPTLKGDPPDTVEVAKENCRIEGETARRAGAPLTANKYHPASLAHRFWREGWDRVGEVNE